MDLIQSYGLVCGIVGFLCGLLTGFIIFFNAGWRKGFR